MGGLHRKLDDVFSFVSQRLSLLFLVRFQQPLCGGGDPGYAPGELGDGGPDLRLPRRVEVAGGVAANGVAVTAQAVDGPPQLRSLDVERRGMTLPS